MEGLLFIACILYLLSAGILFTGCAAQKPIHQKPETHFWHGCQETVLAKPDGFQHFTCFDVKDRQWEVQVKPKEKK